MANQRVGRGGGRQDYDSPSLLTRAVNSVFAFVRLAEFEILFVLFFLIAYVIFKDLRFYDRMRIWFRGAIRRGVLEEDELHENLSKKRIIPIFNKRGKYNERLAFTIRSVKCSLCLYNFTAGKWVEDKVSAVPGYWYTMVHILKLVGSETCGVLEAADPGSRMWQQNDRLLY
ncbi:hypothetical protein ACH5RR_016162 [Cinchona calisaya]|uniref:Uncharacterized protein n=1 Tax=Cinchona calisaya TaxID=153742 RepID=A0ABD2ZWD0_9GENT